MPRLRSDSPSAPAPIGVGTTRIRIGTRITTRITTRDLTPTTGPITGLIIGPITGPTAITGPITGAITAAITGASAGKTLKNQAAPMAWRRFRLEQPIPTNVSFPEGR